MNDKRGRDPLREYGWQEAQDELADGVHPEVVAARLGEPMTYLLEVIEQQGWPVTWKGPTADQILDSAKLDA